MLKAIAGKVWAFSMRHFVDRKSGEYLCPDTWESIGPGRGIYAEGQGGFIDTNCFLLDTQVCYDVFRNGNGQGYRRRPAGPAKALRPTVGIERRADGVLSHQAEQKPPLRALAISTRRRRPVEIHAAGGHTRRGCVETVRRVRSRQEPWRYRNVHGCIPGRRWDVEYSSVAEPVRRGRIFVRSGLRRPNTCASC